MSKNTQESRNVILIGDHRGDCPDKNSFAESFMFLLQCVFNGPDKVDVFSKFFWPLPRFEYSQTVHAGHA